MSLTVILIIIAAAIAVIYLLVGYYCMRLAMFACVIGIALSHAIDGILCDITGAPRVPRDEKREDEILKKQIYLIFLWPSIFFFERSK